MRRDLRIVVCICLCLLALVARGQGRKLTAAEAKEHVGEKATVCGTVASARYADRSNGKPTFLNLDAAYPKEIFTIVIWGSDRDKFEQPESKYANTSVCVSGTITSYRGSPEIVANEPSAIEVQK
jgi:hypothetical protein